jgi:hypothetical protein
MDRPTPEQRHAARRADPMGDDAAEAALRFLVDQAGAAGEAKAKVVYMENFRKIVLNRLKRNSPGKSDAAREMEARAHPEYEAVCVAQREAIEAQETLFWKRIAAEATIEAWRTRAANQRGADKMQ